MASLKEVRNRITSVSSTQQITNAMKMVSAAKLRRAQDAILRLRPYAEKLQEILGNLSTSAENAESGVYTAQREPKKVLMVVISSNRGLAGAFNANVMKEALKIVNTRYASQLAEGNVSWMSIGKKSGDIITKSQFNLLSSHNELFDGLSFEKVSLLAQRIMDGFVAKEFDRVEIVYNRFKNAAVQILTTEQFLPVPPPVASSEGTKSQSFDYIFEPDQQTIVEELIPKSLKTQLYKAILDSFAAEHGARMTAMNKATDNARELLKELRLTYNKARQASITNEILEIVGGAEALNG